jgi:protein-S-isoprenylcysteine O-methyltransferase Ste14
MTKVNHLTLWISLFFWTVMGGMRLAEGWQGGQVTVLLLAAQSILVSWLLLIRRNEMAGANLPCRIVAWLSALLPLGMRLDRARPASQVAMMLGLLLVLWSLLTLRDAFGIAPSDRGLVETGPYRLIRHPMYLGEMICLSGAALSNLSGWNMCLLLVLFCTFWLRMHWEEQMIANYPSYSCRVRWRLIPGIW